VPPQAVNAPATTTIAINQRVMLLSVQLAGRAIEDRQPVRRGEPPAATTKADRNVDAEHVGCTVVENRERRRRST
jgi:hypothetical protein